MSFALIFDGVIAALLVATIVYAAILNRKLTLLRGGNDEMDGLIKRFTQATGRAEGSMSEVCKQSEARFAEARDVALDAHGKLEKLIDAARGLADELAFLVERSADLSGRLDEAITAGRGAVRPTRPQPLDGVLDRGMSDRGMSDRGMPDQAMPDRGVSSKPPPWLGPADGAMTAPASRSEAPAPTAAQTELIKALRGVR